MEKVDINIRAVDEKVRKNFNVLKHKHGEDSQAELLRDLVDFAEQNADKFEREIVASDRDRSHRP